MYDAKEFSDIRVFVDYCDCLRSAKYLNTDYFLNIVKKNKPDEFEKWLKSYMDI